ncbi:MAG: tripartite tricarboxylate transporter TctB family protein [Neomegalonema sp.]|nr:tripartite tricarboxylate transporter TctB family protein [Neomegalonema sp.]
MLTKDRIGALLMLVFCAAYWALAYQIKILPFQRMQAFNAQTMPLVLGGAGVLLSLAILVSPGTGEKLDVRGYRWGVGVAMLGLMVAYGLLLTPLGFIIATTLFLIGGFVILGERSPLTLLLASLPLVFGFWLLMTQGLDVYVSPCPITVKAECDAAVSDMREGFKALRGMFDGKGT